MTMDDNDGIRRQGQASLRWVAGEGWVSVPHLFRVTLRGFPSPIDPTAPRPIEHASYEVQTFLGRDKAVAMATRIHGVQGGFAPYSVEVEELGPTEAGGSPTAYDDRSEW